MHLRWLGGAFLVLGLGAAAACASPGSVASGGSDLSGPSPSTAKKKTPTSAGPHPPVPDGDGPIEVPPPLSPSSPKIETMNPLSITVGSGDVDVTLGGQNFHNDATVSVAGEVVRPTSVDGTSLHIRVPASHLRAPGSVSLKVQNPNQTDGTSNSLALTVFSASSAISVSSVDPAGATAGSFDLPITVSGSGFTSQMKIRFNGSTLATSGSGSSLVGTVPAVLLELAGTYSVAVFDPASGAMTSPQSFVIDRAPDDGTTSSCSNRCIDFGFSSGQCFDGWSCDDSGCLQEQTCTNTCTFSCTDYGYADAQCFGGWQCTGGCLVQQDDCASSGSASGGKSSSGGTPNDPTDAGASASCPACVDPDGLYSYDPGECKSGLCCIGGCLIDDPSP
jgi:hypothetical protein